jgi:hypothetical protein
VRLCGTVLEVDESAGNWRMAVEGSTVKVEVKHRNGAVLEIAARLSLFHEQE